MKSRWKGEIKGERSTGEERGQTLGVFDEISPLSVFACLKSRLFAVAALSVRFIVGYKESGGKREREKSIGSRV